MFLPLFGLLIYVAVASCLVYIVYRSVQAGVIFTKGRGVIRRDEHPVMFWCSIAVQAAVCIYLILWPFFQRHGK